MGSSENFCLRWNDFESNVSGAFRELRAESDFFDVTLTCDDTNANSRRPMQAHKVILSACSNLFKQMLRTQTGHPNPMIYLRGVRTCDLESVLDFMYQGEVNVAQDDLNSFLAVAEDLQIKGLTQNAGGTGAGASSSGAKRGPGRPPKSAASTSSAPAAKRRKPDPDAIKPDPDMDPGGGGGGGGADDPDFDAGEEGYGADAGADDVGYGAAAAAGDDYGGDYGDVGLQGDGGDVSAAAGTSGEQDSSKDEHIATSGDAGSDFNALVDGLMTYENGVHTCNLCGKKSPWRTTMVRHVESNHVETAGHVCDVCGVVSKTRHAFAMHKKRKHGPIDPNTASSATPGTPGVQRKRKSGASAAAAAVAAANAAAAAAAITHVQEPEVKSVILG